MKPMDLREPGDRRCHYEVKIGDHIFLSPTVLLACAEARKMKIDEKEIDSCTVKFHKALPAQLSLFNHST